MAVTVKDLDGGISFGASITGVTFETLQDTAVRKQINDAFEERGLIVFEEWSRAVSCRSN